jgi:pyrimidine oxygenase
MPDKIGKKDIGVFLPIGSGGWIVSSTTPKLDGLWPQNRDAAILADKIGLDFVMSMAKWRGFGGVTDHWGTSLESVAMMSALSQVTTNVKLWATVHTTLNHPVATAKQISTLDQVSNGRAGLNIVVGGRGDFYQMGLWETMSARDDKYQFTEEWTEIVKRLWSEERVDFDGRYFQLHDCVSSPKPIARPRPDIICAGLSQRGFEFSVREADACFTGGRDADETRNASLRARALAEKYGKPIKVYAMCTVVYGDTDAKAEAIAQKYRDGVDLAGVEGMGINAGLPPGADNAMIARARTAFLTETVIGSPQTCLEQMDVFLTYCQLDGLMLIFPDYIEGLTMFGEEILPRLREITA